MSGTVEAPGVAFVGHLSRDVAGIDVPVSAPAELVRQAYARWGTSCFSRLEGNFSVCVFDPALPGFIVARDAAGTHPIFFAHSSGPVFGTSALEVLGACGLPPVADAGAMLRFLADGAVAGSDQTIFRGVHALPAAHFLEAGLGQPARIHPMADGLETVPIAMSPSLEGSAREMRDLLLEAVGAQSRGAKAAVTLSGGIDSSGIAAALREVAGAGEAVHAFCFVHRHPGLPASMEELPSAQLAARHLAATLHTVTLESAAIPEAMSRVARAHDFPFGSPVILAQAEVFRVAADEGIEVMLSGHGPDYLFGGGNSHIMARAAALLRHGRLAEALAFSQGASAYAASSPARILLASLRRAALPARRPRAIPAVAGARKSWFRERRADRRGESLFASGDPLRRIILEQVHHLRLPSALHWESRNAAMAGLDNRWPYLVPAMMRLSSRLPAELLVSPSGQTRPVLRLALRGLVARCDPRSPAFDRLCGSGIALAAGAERLGRAARAAGSRICLFSSHPRLARLLDGLRGRRPIRVGGGLRAMAMDLPARMVHGA
jgi:asparagine synthase (glutamine-hydrolysing)